MSGWTMWNDYCRLDDEPSSPLRAIRLHCLECCGSHSGFTDVTGEEVPPKKEMSDVRDCPVTSCKVWIYRFGKNPNHGQFGRKKKARKGVSAKSGTRRGGNTRVPTALERSRTENTG